MGAWTFLTNVIDVTPSAGGWATIDVSSYVPSDAKFIILKVVNTAVTGYRYGVRATDSSDNRFQSISSYGSGCAYAIVKLNDRKFQGYIENSAMRLYLLGWGNEDLVSSNATDKSTTTTGSWVDVDNSDISGSFNGVIFEMSMNSLNNFLFALRPKGSTWSESNHTFWNAAYGSHTWVAVGVDSDKRCQQYIGNTTCKLYRYGTTGRNSYFWTNPPYSWSVTTAGTWQTISLASYIPANANGVLIAIQNTSTSSVFKADVRKNGSTDNHYGGSYGTQIGQATTRYAFVGVDSNRQIQVIAESTTSIVFYLMGYFTSSAEVSDDVSSSDGVAITQFRDVSESLQSSDSVSSGSIDVSAIRYKPQVFVNGNEVNPVNLKVRLSGEFAGDFEMTLEDSDGNIRNWLDVGQDVDIWLRIERPLVGGGGNADIYDKIFYGAVEDIQLETPVPTLTYLHIRGRDRFTIDLTNRIVTEVYENETVSNIIRDLVAKYLPWANSGGVKDINVTIPKIIFAYRTLKDCFDIISAFANAVYYCFPNKKVYFLEKEVKDSGLEVTDMDILDILRSRVSLIPVKNVVYVIGGNTKVEDVVRSGTPSGGGNLSQYWYAVPFVAGQDSISQVSLYLSKSGTPTEDLSGYIATDSGGNPSSNYVASFSFDKDYIDETAGWKPIEVKANLVKGNTYWIVLKKTSGSVYGWNWYDGSGLSFKYSSDGQTWTTVSNKCLMFKTYFDMPVIVRRADAVSRGKYRTREFVITDKGITDMDTARKLADAKLAELKDAFEEIDGLKVRQLYNFPIVGELISVKSDLARINDKYLLKEITLEFTGGEERAWLILRLGDTITKLQHALASLRREINIAKVEELSVGILSLSREFTDSVTITDSYSATEKTSGTFQVDSAKVGYSDVGSG